MKNVCIRRSRPKPMTPKQQAKREAAGETFLASSIARSPKKSKPHSRPDAKQKRRKPVKAVNSARRKKEFARCYGSSERVEFVKALPCLLCEALIMTAGAAELMSRFGATSENAHTVTGGKGRKANYDTIVPLCRGHHQCYDRHIAPFDRPEMRDVIKARAPEVEARWQNHISRGISSNG